MWLLKDMVSLHMKDTFLAQSFAVSKNCLVLGKRQSLLRPVWPSKCQKSIKNTESKIISIVDPMMNGYQLDLHNVRKQHQ